jgi:hypothetical protein
MQTVAHLVFAALRTDAATDGDRLDAVSALTSDLLGRLTGQVEAMFPDGYVTSLFKNATKCRQLATAVQGLVSGS